MERMLPFSVEKLLTNKKIGFFGNLGFIQAKCLPPSSACSMLDLFLKMDELRGIVSTVVIDVICITETWLSPAVARKRTVAANTSLLAV